MAETFVVNENDFEYRFGDSGPKYLMKGPRMNYALVQFQPGQSFQAHHHNDIGPGEVHYVNNPYDKVVKMVSTLAPFQEVDKIEDPNPEY